MSNDSIFTTPWNDASEIENSYTRLCISALLAALFGVTSFLVYFSPWFAFLGIIALVFSLFALVVIHRSEGILFGKFLAYAGLCSAIIALLSITVFWAVYQQGIRKEADQFFRLWFAAVQKGDVPQAKEYISVYYARSKAADSETWWRDQYAEKYAHRAVHQYVEDKLLRVLIALGDKAQVSYYKTENLISDRESDTILMVYAVTYPGESGNTETFFVRIGAKRVFPAESSNFRTAGWRLEGTPAFYVPEEFK